MTSVQPSVIIRRYWHGNNPGTELFIDYAGRRFYSRQWNVVDDTPHTKAAIAQEFLTRLARFPSTILAGTS